MTLPIPDAGVQLTDWYSIVNAINNMNQFSRKSALTATGSSQSGALQLKAVLNFIGTTPANSGVILPLTTGPLKKTPTKVCAVYNQGANALTIYGSGSNTVNGVAAATGIQLAAGAGILFFANDSGAWVSVTDPNALAPLAAGASVTLTGANNNQTILLNTAAGSVVTLPAAAGTGARFNFVVTATTTSGAHKILAASTADYLNGIVTGENAGTPKGFPSAASTNHSIQMPYTGSQPSGGFIGDWFEFIDVAPNLWQVSGMFQAGTTPTTPFSSADS